MAEFRTSRRGLIKAGLAGLSGVALAGCGKIANQDWVTNILDGTNEFTYRVQRAILGEHAMAREYAESDISPHFKPNGSTDPSDPAYKAMVTEGFKTWKLDVGGLVDHPFQISMAELRAMPSRTQITRHDCVEGWSCIGKWTGVPLSLILDRAGVKDEARYVLFRCADTMDDGALDGPTRFYGTIDLVAARHPQTILAYDMNGAPLQVPYGAPLRVRVERQLGYKSTKYIMKIELVDSYADEGEGKGGYWEDNGYDWYAGI